LFGLPGALGSAILRRASAGRPYAHYPALGQIGAAGMEGDGGGAVRLGFSGD